MMSFNKMCNITFKEFLSSINYSFAGLCERIKDKALKPGDREKIEALPNYDSEIFKEITGISFDGGDE